MMRLRESREEKGRSQGSVCLRGDVYMSPEDLVKRFKSRVEPESLRYPQACNLLTLLMGTLRVRRSFTGCPTPVTIDPTSGPVKALEDIQ